VDVGVREGRSRYNLQETLHELIIVIESIAGRVLFRRLYQRGSTVVVAALLWICSPVSVRVRVLVFVPVLAGVLVAPLVTKSGVEEHINILVRVDVGFVVGCAVFAIIMSRR
jgi:hypothetical protein